VGVRVRNGGPQDVEAVLGLFDGAVRWLTERGLTGQWGTALFSTRPERIAQARGWARSGGLRIADADGTAVGAMVVGESPVYVFSAREPNLYVLRWSARSSIRRVGAPAACCSTTPVPRRSNSASACSGSTAGRAVTAP
jgi:hypothetical protein